MKEAKTFLLLILITVLFTINPFISNTVFSQDASVKVKVYLQGAWNGTPGMKTTLVPITWL